MPAEIKIDTDYAIKEGTAKISASFTDETGAAATPGSITWTLTDADGTIINSRKDESIAVPASSIDVGLAGDDLAYQTGENGEFVERKFLLEWIYSSSLGADLPGKDELKFNVYNAVGVQA